MADESKQDPRTKPTHRQDPVAESDDPPRALDEARRAAERWSIEIGRRKSARDE